MDQRKFSTLTELGGLGNFDDNNKGKSDKPISKQERKAIEKAAGGQKNEGEREVDGPDNDVSENLKKDEPIYSTISYNSSIRRDNDNNRPNNSETTYKNYYEEGKGPTVSEKVFEDYKSEDKIPEEASPIRRYKQNKKSEEEYHFSQDYLAHSKNKENKIQRLARTAFARIFPDQIKSTDKKEGEFPADKALDQMGFVVNKKDLEMQEVARRETDHWKNELSKIYDDKAKNKRNRKELKEFNKNPYDWARVALSNQVNRLKNDLEKSANKNERESLKKKISGKEKTLNTITNAIQKKIALQLDENFYSNGMTFGNGNFLDVEVGVDEINKVVDSKSISYRMVGVVLRGKEKFLVLRNEKGERVELKMENAEKIAKETSIDFKKAKEKEERLENIQVNDVVKIRTGGLDGKRSSYKITKVEKGKIFFEDTATNQKGNMSIEDMRSFLMDKNKDFVVEKSEEYKNREELKNLENFNEKIEELKIRQTIGKRNATPEERMKVWREELALLGFGNVEIGLGGQVEDKEGIEKKEQKEKRGKEIMKEIGNIFRKNNLKLDRVVIHGYSYENKEGELMSHWDVDSDTRGALYLLHLAGIRTGEIEKTHKGTEVEPKPGEVMMYIDTSGKTLSVERKNGGVQIIDDHHQRDYQEEKTSATKELYETLLENNLIERQPWIDRLVDCIDQEDNLSYVDTKRFNKDYFKYKYASSLFALQKEVSFQDVLRWCKEGKDLYDPKFTEKELQQDVKITIEIEGWEGKDGKKSKAYKEVMVPLAGVIAKIQTNIDSDFKAFEFARRKMDERGIRKETKELGRILYNIPDFQKLVGKNKGKFANKFNYPFLTTKAMGGDTYISYSELTKKYFINSSTYDLTFVDKELSKRVPNSNMVNGVMILPPKTMNDRRVMTEEEFLKVIKIKE